MSEKQEPISVSGLIPFYGTSGLLCGWVVQLVFNGNVFPSIMKQGWRDSAVPFPHGRVGFSKMVYTQQNTSKINYLFPDVGLFDNSYRRACRFRLQMLSMMKTNENNK